MHWPTFSDTPNHARYCTVKVLSAAPPLASVAVDDSELQGKSLAYMRSSMGKVLHSFVVAASWEFAVVASTGVVAAGTVEEHAVEVHSFAVVGANLSDSVLEMVPRRNCGGLFAAVDTNEEERSGGCFGYNMLRLNLPSQAFEEAVPKAMAGIAGDFEADWEGNRKIPASDLAIVGNFVGWMLVEVLGGGAVGVDRKSMMKSRVSCHVVYIATEAQDSCCSAIAN